MLLRGCRMSTAARPVPSTRAGISMRLRLPSGSSAMGTKPEAGSQPSRTETSRMSMMPSQKFGTDTPHREAPLASRSHTVLRRTAAITPAGSAMARATSSDRKASSMVMGSLAATVAATGWRVRIDSPRSPRTASPAHLRYWTTIESFSPYFSRTSSSPASSASVPASTRAGSPGSIRTPENTTRLMRTSVTPEMSARRARNSITAQPAPGLVPGRALDPDEAVRHGLVTLQVLREGDDVVLVIEVEDVAARGDEVGGFAVEAGACRDVHRLARLVQQRVHPLVAGERGVEGAPACLRV